MVHREATHPGQAAGPGKGAPTAAPGRGPLCPHGGQAGRDPARHVWVEGRTAFGPWPPCGRSAPAPGLLSTRLRDDAPRPWERALLGSTPAPTRPVSCQGTAGVGRDATPLPGCSSLERSRRFRSCLRRGPGASAVRGQRAGPARAGGLARLGAGCSGISRRRDGASSSVQNSLECVWGKQGRQPPRRAGSGRA